MKLFSQVEQIKKVKGVEGTGLRKLTMDLAKERSRRDSTSIAEPSRVGKQLSDLTTRRVIVLVLFMIITLPLLESATYTVTVTPGEAGLQPVHELAAINPQSREFNDSLSYYATDNLRPLFITVYGISNAVINSIVGFTVTDQDVLRDYRTTEIDSTQVSTCYDAVTKLEIPGSSACLSYAYFDARGTAIQDAYLNILKTIFVIVVLAAGVIMLTNDAENLVIQPIERMVEKVMQLAKDPLGSVAPEDSEDTQGKRPVLVCVHVCVVLSPRQCVNLCASFCFPKPAR